jgi:hypothetical protein
LKAQISIKERFCGVPNFGNGGYTCGLLANFIKGSAEVTLWKPPPLNTQMEVKSLDNEQVQLFDKDVKIAEASPVELELTPPKPPSLKIAEESTKKEEDVTDHYFPTCFVCGTQRKIGDGLRIFPGAVADQNYVAAIWTPDSSFADETGYIKNEIIWAALDCPGAWAIIKEEFQFIVLGRFTVKIFEKIKPEEKCIVLGWKISEEGRKVSAGTALYSADGQLYGMGKAVWIKIESP